MAELGRAYNSKQFLLKLSTTHAEDLCNCASYDAYITGSNKIFYLHEYFKHALWKRVEDTGFAAESIPLHVYKRILYPTDLYQTGQLVRLPPPPPPHLRRNRNHGSSMFGSSSITGECALATSFFEAQIEHLRLLTFGVATWSASQTS